MINATMVKQKSKLSTLKQKIVVLALMGIFSVGFFAAPFAAADTFQDQINRLQSQNAENYAAVDKLEEQATSYKDAIAKLEAQINQLQGQIDANKNEQARLNNEIAAAELELEKQKELLGQNIKSMYLEGDISTLEMLATSKDLSDFVDKEQYRKNVQDKIKSTLDKINALRLELKTKKTAVDALLKEQQAQQNQLSSSRQQQHSLLTMNQAQIDAYNAKTAANQQKIGELIAAQIAANQSLSGGMYFIRFPGGVGAHNPNVDDYPYKNAGFSMQLGPCSSNDSWPDSPDKWGYCTRQCVSYAAWAVERSGRAAPYFYGNAKDWIYAAQNRGIPVYSEPKAGDVAISTAGTWGHAMYVESVSGDVMLVSQYNVQLDGRYSTQWRKWR